MPKKEIETELYLQNRQRKIRVDLERLRRRVISALEVSGLDLQSLGIILVSDRRIAWYNRRYLKHKGATDVISFKTGPRRGELLISAETARAQARAYRHSLERELLTLVIHGFLHLAGYRDYRPEERREMDRETDRILTGEEEKDA